jgi:hypothetical protein
VSATQTNRLNRLASAVDARTHAQHSAFFGDETSNPYPVGTYFWCVWCASYQDMVDRLERADAESREAERHEREFAERCLRDGEICRGEEVLDAREPSWFDWFFNTGGK